MSEVKVQKIEKFGANGDRAIQKTRYYDYMVMVDGEEFQTISGYDNWHSHIRIATEVKKEAYDLAHKVARIVKSDGIIIEETLLKEYKVSLEGTFLAASEEEAIEIASKTTQKFKAYQV